MTRLSLAALALLSALAAATAGCAGTTPADAEYPEEADRSPTERIAQQRAALAALRKRAFAEQAAGDLGKAESWIGQAERLVAAEEDRNLDLLLQAVEGQLALVQSFYGRREAEAALERVRAEYERRRATDADMARQIEQITNAELSE
ncbi:MAG TPA: hypothetical protein VLS89_10580 [Candidatus Nanopelagicales bacterium]|nr:hypothetical protein [Candidatus Nanopelagicales bacterium]